jgi:hypothetical protein
MTDKFDNFINYAIQNGSNPNVELEARFGKYSKITSNIKPKMFFQVYNLFKSRSKSYSFIKDILYGDVRKRTISDDFKNYTKTMFDTPDTVADVIQDYTKTYSKAGKNTIYLSKEKILKPIQIENIKIDLVLENPNQSAPTDKATYQKNKFRCSLKGIWDIDMTILLITDCKTGKSGLYFEIEMEFNYKFYKSKNLTHGQILEDFNNNSNTIITSIDCIQNTPLNVELRYGIFNQVVTLEKQYLPTLINGKYSVTEKADGERVFIYIDDKKNIYRLNPTNVILDKTILAKLEKTLKITNTLIDGELLSINGKNTFLGFDLLYYNGKDYRNFNLDTRLKYLSTVINDLNKIKLEFIFKVKVFYTTDVFTNAAKIWNNRAKLFPYNLDGLIFTPIRGSYQGNLPNFKWKDKHSIDVRIMYNNKFNFTEFHPFTMPYTRKGSTEIANAYTDNQSGNVYFKRRINVDNLPQNQIYKQMNLVNNRGDLGVSGQLLGTENFKNMVDIVEVEYDPSSRKWVFLRTRPDKERPNAFKSIISVLNAISDNITVAYISKIKHKISPYELVCNETSSKSSHVTCCTNIGFNFTSPDISSSMCQFYTYAYNTIFQKITPNGKTILILGCDICVIQAASKKYKNILILEPNCLEIYGEHQSEGYSGLKEHARVMGINASIIWGSSDISSGLKAFTKSGQDEINKFMKKHFKKNELFDLVFINTFSDMFYNEKISKDMFDKNIKNLKMLAKQIVGIYLNGTQIIKHLERQECLLTKNKELHPLYRIFLKYKNLTKYKETDIFKIKNNLKMIEIQRMQNSFISQLQPLIFDKNIQDMLKNSGSKIQDCKSLKSLYSSYKTDGGILNDYDCIIADITKYFII